MRLYLIAKEIIWRVYVIEILLKSLFDFLLLVNIFTDTNSSEINQKTITSYLNYSNRHRLTITMTMMLLVKVSFRNDFLKQHLFNKAHQISLIKWEYKNVIFVDEYNHSLISLYVKFFFCVCVRVSGYNVLYMYFPMILIILILFGSWFTLVLRYTQLWYL